MDDTTNLPASIDGGRGLVSTLDQLADIPKEEIWLSKQKSARTRRAYRLDVQHFMKTLGDLQPLGFEIPLHLGESSAIPTHRHWRCWSVSAFCANGRRREQASWRCARPRRTWSYS